MCVPRALLFVGEDAQSREMLPRKAAQKVGLARMEEISLPGQGGSVTILCHAGHVEMSTALQAWEGDAGLSSALATLPHSAPTPAAELHLLVVSIEVVFTVNSSSRGLSRSLLFDPDSAECLHALC